MKYHVYWLWKSTHGGQTPFVMLDSRREAIGLPQIKQTVHCAPLTLGFGLS